MGGTRLWVGGGALCKAVERGKSPGLVHLYARHTPTD